MRRIILFGLILLLCTVPGTSLRALVSGAVNIAKENGYAVLTPPAGDALVAKQNGYAVLAPPGGALIAKMNAYAVVQKRLPTVQIIE